MRLDSLAVYAEFDQNPVSDGDAAPLTSLHLQQIRHQRLDLGRAEVVAVGLRH